MISVLMATYDGAAFVAAAVESVLAQHAVELELVVTDDGSSDATPQIVRELARRDDRVRFVVQPHGGAARARNCCLKRACGDYIALLDQDDLFPEGKLARQCGRLAARPGLAGVFGLTETFGASTGESPGHTMLLSAGLLRREVVAATGGFDPRCGTADDLDFLLRLIETGHELELELELGVRHRRHPGQTSANRARCRRDCVRALARSLNRRREQGLDGPLRHPLLTMTR